MVKPGSAAVMSCWTWSYPLFTFRRLRPMLSPNLASSTQLSLFLTYPSRLLNFSRVCWRRRFVSGSMLCMDAALFLQGRQGALIEVVLPHDLLGRLLVGRASLGGVHG